MAFIFSLLGGAVGKYLVIALGLFAAVTWIRAEAAAPYKAKIAAFEENFARRIQIEKADAERAESDRAEIARLQATVESIAHESRLAGSCQLSAVDLERLHKLAAAGR